MSGKRVWGLVVAGCLVIGTGGGCGSGGGGGESPTGDRAAPARSSTTTAQGATSSTTGRAGGGSEWPPASEPAPEVRQPDRQVPDPLAPGSSDPRVQAQTSDDGADVRTVPATPRPPLPIHVELGSTCVRPGGKQTIRIDIGYKGGVAYHAVYSDGKTAYDEGYYGGNNGKHTDDEGVWEDTWVVAPTAPPGPVKVYVVAAAPGRQPNKTETKFSVAEATGSCS